MRKGETMEYLAANWIILLLMGVYGAFCLGAGWWFRKRASRGVNEYFVAKREIPGWVIALAFYSTFISTNTYIGQAGHAFKAGLCWAWVGVFWTAFCMVSWLVLGPRLRRQTAAIGSVTIPDYFDYRYKSELSKAMRVLSAFVILFATMWYMAGIAKGCAHLLESILQIPYAYGVLLIIFLTCAYTVWGGMYSVLWVDAIQGLMMFIVAIIMVLIPVIYVGGFEPLMARVANVTHVTAGPNPMPMGDGLVTFCSLVSFTYILGIGLAVGMKQISEPRCLIRFYSVDNAKSMKFGMIATPILLGISLVCVMGLGALVHGMTTDAEAAFLVNNTDEVIGTMLAKCGSPLLSGICMAGLFAAGMSSLASVTLIVGTAFVGDMLRVFRPMSEGAVVTGTKWTMVIYCAIVFVIAVLRPAGIVELTAFSGAVFAASFFPAVFGGLYLRWGTGHGAFYSILIGMVCCVGWRLFVKSWLPGMEEVNEIIPSFVVSLIAFLAISRLTRDKTPPKDHLDRVFGT